MTRRSEQALDLFLVGVGRPIGEKCRHLLGRGRQARQVERHPTQQAGFFRLGRWVDFLFGEPGVNERVDGVYLAARLSRHRRWHERRISPVRLIHGAFRDPAAKQFFLRRRERFMRVEGRHRVTVVKNTTDDFAVVGLARHDGKRLGLGRL